MNGAQALIKTLVASGVDVCFTNPGTSEMHFVAALDSVPEMRPILALFEGVVTGAADGYARMADRPGSTLLHLGPGLCNGLANVHNAKKGRVPMVNIVGDQATYHKQYDTPLTGDIEALARPLSHWVRTCADATDVARDAAEAVASALTPPGQISTLILPADVSWNEAGDPAPGATRPERGTVPGDRVDSVARALKSGEKAVLVMNGQALRGTSEFHVGDSMLYLRESAGAGSRGAAGTSLSRPR